MRFITFKNNNTEGVAVLKNGEAIGLLSNEDNYPGNLTTLIKKEKGALEEAYQILLKGNHIDTNQVDLLPPITTPGKILCIGLNYVDHSAESGFQQPEFPTIFGRVNSGLLGHNAPMVKPKVSDQLDFEGELAVVIGREGKHISTADALDYVAGYSVFNDGSVRDYQIKTPQWFFGKNFDNTGAFGPEFVSADELPPGAKGLKLETRLNGEVLQSANTSDMVFGVADLIEYISKGMTLYPGDVIVAGTPSGIGFSRKPQVWMKPGDVCEVEIEHIGLLRNTIKAE